MHAEGLRNLGTAREVAKGVIIGLVVDIILLGLPYLTRALGFNLQFDLLQMGVPLWITILIIIVIIPTIAMASRRRGGGIVVSTGRRRPESDVVNVEHNYAGVRWKILYGRVSLYRTEEPYAFCFSNPYCPKCDYEMEAEERGMLFKRHYWRCDRCGNFYKCPTSHPFDAHEVVERLVEADFRTGRLKYPY
jgi:ribosomal protein L37AE/L43A